MESPSKWVEILEIFSCRLGEPAALVGINGLRSLIPVHWGQTSEIKPRFRSSVPKDYGHLKTTFRFKCFTYENMQWLTLNAGESVSNMIRPVVQHGSTTKEWQHSLILCTRRILSMVTRVRRVSQRVIHNY
jgi:hypothetical protein